MASIAYVAAFDGRWVKDRKDEAREEQLERGRRREARQRQVGRIVEWAAGEAMPQDRQGAEHLAREACDRLDDDDIYGDLLSRPVGELVAMVCKDLGIEVDWEALSDEAWALAEIESGAAGSPFLAWPPPAVVRASGLPSGGPAP